MKRFLGLTVKDYLETRRVRKAEDTEASCKSAGQKQRLTV